MPVAAIIPIANGKSYDVPSFLMSAGARFITIWHEGTLYPFTLSADMILSWLSFTAESGSPTRKNFIPLEVFTSMVTMLASMPCTAAPYSFTNMFLLFLVFVFLYQIFDFLGQFLTIYV